MAEESLSDTLAAWLDTIAADSEGGDSPQTVMPKAASQQPLLASFQSFRDTSSAAPINVGATIAEGGMGVIKIAEQAALGRTVVIKTLRAESAAQATEHVLREAWATGALEHPNIVPVHDIRTDEQGSPMIVLKRIEGRTWTQLMHNPDLVRETFGVSSVLDWNTDILRQVTQAIRFAHSRGILHRDLKPDNVMIGSFGEVYLVDWGIALGLQSSDSTRLPLAQDSKEMAGTPCYMAPEMLGESPLDERTDVYLLGAILFEILAGRPPHRLSSLSNLMEDIRASEPNFPERACPLLSDICRRAMSRDPDKRFQDADAFAQALVEVREHRESADMAKVASEQLEQLETLLSEDEPSRNEVYGLFGALRLGFREALRTWPGNSLAQEALDRAILALIAYELEERNPRAAQTLFKDLRIPKSEVQDQITAAMKTQASDQAELEMFRHDSDLAVGQRSRFVVMVILGVLWTLSPIVRSTQIHDGGLMGYNQLILGTLAFFVLNMGLWFWARESLRKTQFNRRLGRSLFLAFPAQGVLLLGLKFMDVPVEQSAPLMLFLWTIVAANVTLLIDKRFWPTTTSYVIAFLFASRFLEQRYFALAAGNFILLCNVAYIWWPGTFRKKQD